MFVCAIEFRCWWHKIQDTEKIKRICLRHSVLNEYLIIFPASFYIGLKKCQENSIIILTLVCLLKKWNVSFAPQLSRALIFYNGVCVVTLFHHRCCASIFLDLLKFSRNLTWSYSMNKYGCLCRNWISHMNKKRP